jgi:hypothetical protein
MLNFKLNRVILFLCMITFASAAFCQTQKQWLKHADKSFDEKDYYGASIYYRKAMLVDSSNLPVVYKYAESLRLYNEYKLAKKYYNYVFTKDNVRTFQECLYWLATMQKFSAEYVEARKNFMRFLSSYKQKDSFFYKKAQQEVKSCEFAIELMRDTVSVNIFNLGDSVNTINSEFSVLPVNDSLLIFSSLRSEKMRENSSVKDEDYFLKIYQAEKADTLWKIKNVLDSVINKAGTHNANSSISPDGQKFYFSRCDNDMKCFIYVSELKNGQWQQAKKLNDSINYPGFTATQPLITSIDSNEVLFYVSDRPGGMGRLDIWLSISANGDFSSPINLGKAINSIDDEISPWYVGKSKTLYFSSAWHYGLGGFDIFKTSYANGGFSKPQNLGYPFNTSVNDFYFTYDADSKSGFLTSNRKGSMFRKAETCCNDLWYYKMFEKVVPDTTPVVKVNSLDELMKFIPVKLYFQNDEPNPRSRDTITSLNYLTSYKQYKEAMPHYKENYSKGLKDEKKLAAEDSVHSFFEHHLDKGVQDLELFTELLLKELEKGHKLDLMVKGNASSLAKTAYNVPLTLRRISSLENYLSEYKDHALLPYLKDSAANGGSLKIIKIPLGEYKAHEYLSDNLNDKKNSVYSISAAMHRNIEIVSVTLAHKDSSAAEMRFKKEVYDFGSVKAGEKHTHIFRFKNTGKESLQVSSINPSCDCIAVKGPLADIAPGEKGEVEVTFDTKGLKGKQLQTIMLTTNGIPAIKELTITAEIK